MRIEAVTSITPEHVEAFAWLLPLQSQGARHPTAEQLPARFGELWRAHSEDGAPLEPGETVEVASVGEGLELGVRRNPS